MLVRAAGLRAAHPPGYVSCTPGVGRRPDGHGEMAAVRLFVQGRGVGVVCALLLALLPVGLCFCVAGHSAESSQCHSDGSVARVRAACCCAELSAAPARDVAARGPEDASPEILLALRITAAQTPSRVFVATPSIHRPAHSPPALATPLRI